MSRFQRTPLKSQAYLTKISSLLNLPLLCMSPLFTGVLQPALPSDKHSPVFQQRTLSGPPLKLMETGLLLLSQAAYAKSVTPWSKYIYLWPHRLFNIVLTLAVELLDSLGYGSAIVLLIRECLMQNGEPQRDRTCQVSLSLFVSIFPVRCVWNT